MFSHRGFQIMDLHRCNLHNTSCAFPNRRWSMSFSCSSLVLFWWCHSEANISLKWGRYHCVPLRNWKDSWPVSKTDESHQNHKVVFVFLFCFFLTQRWRRCFLAQKLDGSSAWMFLFAVKSGQPIAGVKARIFSLWQQHKGTAAEKSLCARSIFFDICSKVQGSGGESAQRTGCGGGWQASVWPLA